jgi:hypothetical protein
MTDLPDLREQITDLFRDGSLYRESPAGIADAVLAVLPEGWDRFVRTIALLHDRLAETTRERDVARADYSQLAREARGEIDAATREVERLRREVEFEANGADTFNGADLKAAELATPDEWSKRFGVKVWDPDGWRSDGKAWDEPISKAEFERRLAVSTAGPSVHPEGGGS